MTAQSSNVTPGKRGGWGRKLAIVAGALIVLLVVVYFVVTSSAFFKGVILPRVGKAMNAQIRVADASISPFSQIILKKLNLQTTGSEPLFEAEEIRLHYNLRSILAGTIKVDEVTVTSPVIRVVQNADGTSNVDPLLPKETTEKPTKKPSGPLQLQVRNVSVKNAAVHAVRNLKDNVRETFDLTDVNLALDQLQNGLSGKLTLAASMKMERTQKDVRDSLQSKGVGAIEFTLGPDLMPQIVKGSVTHEVVKADGRLAELAGHRTVMTPDLAPGEIKQASLRFFKADRLLGEVRAYGPFDATKKEGKLTIEISSIDRQVLNLAGALWGIDFGGTTLSSTNVIELRQNGAAISVNGRFNASKLGVTQNGKSSPPVELAISYGVAVNSADDTARIDTFTVSGMQNQQPFLTGQLARPVGITLGKSPGLNDDSTFELKITDFKLEDWRGFLGETIPVGRVQFALNLVSQQKGKSVKLDAAARIDELTTTLGGQPFDQGQLIALLRGNMDNTGKLSLDDYKLSLTRRQQPAVNLAGSATYDSTGFVLRSRVDLVPLTLMGRGPTNTISADLQTEGAFRNKTFDLKKMQLSFSPTKLAAKNEVQASGKLDTANPKLTTGNLSITSDTLDVTPFYDTFAGSAKPASTAEPTAATPAAPAPNVEPKAMDLPFDLTLKTSIGRLFLREIVVSDLVTSVTIANNHLVLDPFKGNLNGAPLNAKANLDLGIPGYGYDVEFTANRIPLEPIANSFSPENRGQYQGAILADARIQGAGVTGASLKKSLKGQLGLSFTNANIQITGRKTRAVLVPIGALLRIDDITRLPLNWVDCQLNFGDGKIAVSRFISESGAFEAIAQGAIPIADVLNQSPLDLPVDFSLRRSLAQKANLIPANTPTNATYVALPGFVTVKGTLDTPKADINKKMITGLLVKSGIGIAENLGVKTDGKGGDVLKGVGDLLTGQGSNTSTNKSGDTNKPPAFNPLNLLKKPKK